jgi:hypothetical protein
MGNFRALGTMGQGAGMDDGVLFYRLCMRGQPGRGLYYYYHGV